MGIIDSKTFKSGNSVAIRLPKAIGLEADVPVRIQYEAGVITIRPIEDASEGKKRVAELVAALRALPAPGYIEKREPIEFPDRERL